jgi:hypothetical protein
MLISDESRLLQKDDLLRRLPATFAADLRAAIDDFEASLTPPESATDVQVEATAQLGEAVRRGMISRRILQGLMKLKYKTNPTRMRAWASASHLERDNKDDQGSYRADAVVNARITNDWLLIRNS